MLASWPAAVPRDLASAVAGPWGWAAMIVAAAAAILGAGVRPAWSVNRIGVTLMIFSGLAALTTTSLGQSGWTSFHVLVGLHLMAACLLAGWGWWRGQVVQMNPIAASSHPAPGQVSTPVSSEAGGVLSYHRPESRLAQVDITTQFQITSWAMGVAAVALILAIRATVGDPARQWQAPVTVLVGLLVAFLGVWNLRRSYIYGAGLVLNLAASLWLFANPLALPGSTFSTWPM